MKIKMFAIFDSKIGGYLQPFFAPTAGAAVRMLIDAAKDPNTQFYNHPKDYSLFEIGEYDEDRGVCTSLDSKISLGSVHELNGPEKVQVRDFSKDRVIPLKGKKKLGKARSMTI